MKSSKIPVLCAIFAAGFLFFFTTKLWYNAVGDLVDATKVGDVISCSSSNCDITLQRWEYDEKKNCMEVEFSSDYNGTGDVKYVISAKTRNKGDIDVKKLANDDEMILVKLYNIPEKWREIALSITVNGESLDASFYTNNKEVSVKTLNKMTKDEYLLAYYNRKLEIEDNKKAKIDKQIEKIKEKILDVNDSIAKLEEDKKKNYGDEEELTSSIDSLKSTKSSYGDEIASLQDEQDDIDDQKDLINNKIRDIEEGTYSY